MTEFKREKRYIVLKISDLDDARLSPDQHLVFNEVCDKVARVRAFNRKPPLQCVVVESDWPEYEPTWSAIKERMTKNNIECDGCGDIIDESYTKECPHCGKTKCVKCDMGDDVECPSC